MRNVHIPGAVRDVGASQGYTGLSVLYTRENLEVRGDLIDVGVVKVAYELTPDEVRSLVEGGRVVLTIVGGPGHMPPHRLEVSTS